MSCATVSVYIIYVLSYLFIYSYVLFIVTHIQLCSTASTNTCRETTTPIQVGWASCVRYGIDAQLTWSCLFVAAGSARSFSSCTGNISQWRRKVLTFSLGLRLPKQCHGQKTANKIPLETLESTEPTRGCASVESNKCFLEPRFTHGSCQEYHCPRHLDLLQSALPSETIVFKLVVNIISGSRNSGWGDCNS